MRIKLFILAFLISTGAWGQEPQHTYESPLLGVSPGWNNLELPNTLFENVQPNFSDLRFYTITSEGDTVELPYLLEQRVAKTKREEIIYKLVSLKKVGNEYHYIFFFEDSSSVDEMELNFNSNGYDFKVAVDGSADQDVWIPLVDDHRLLRIMNDYMDYKYNKVDIPKSRYAYYRLRIPSDAKPVLIMPKLFKKTVYEGKERTYDVEHMSVSRNNETKTTIVDIDLANRVAVSRLKVMLKDSNDYYRTMRILHLVDSVKTEKGYKNNYSEVGRVILNSIENEVFNFNNVITKQIRLVIEDHDNLPLTIDEVQLSGYVYEAKIRIDKRGNHIARYGAQGMDLPVYDLVHFKQKIPGSMTTIELGKEKRVTTIKETSSLFENKAWLYLIISIVVVVIGLFAFKMMHLNDQS